jgi:hypothetical protein
MKSCYEIDCGNAVYFVIMAHKFRPIGQFAGYDMPTSPINTGEESISNL